MLGAFLVIKPTQTHNRFYGSLSRTTRRQEEHLARKERVMRCWHCCLSVARCKWLAYGPVGATASENPEWFILLVLAYPGCPGKKAVKRLCVCLAYVSGFCMFLYNLGFLYFCSVCFFCVWYSFHSTKPRDWLGRASPKWLYLVSSGTLNLSSAQLSCT